MNNILSIDLDILFTPYVGIYNSFINNSYNCEALWKEIEQYHNIKDFEPHQEYCKLILDILQHYSKQVKQIYIGVDHGEILTAIESEKNHFNQPYQFNIYNIDFHHDIAYNNQTAIKDIQNHYVTCVNWVGFLNYYHYINNYYWYEGIGSDFDQFQLNNNLKILKPNNFQRTLFSNKFPMNLNISLLYIFISPPWIPPCYYKIINLILSILDKKKIVYLNQSYATGNFKKPFLNEKGEQGYYDFLFLKKS